MKLYEGCKFEPPLGQAVMSSLTREAKSICGVLAGPSCVRFSSLQAMPTSAHGAGRSVGLRRAAPDLIRLGLEDGRNEAIIEFMHIHFDATLELRRSGGFRYRVRAQMV